MSRRGRKESINLDEMEAAFAWDDEAFARSTASTGQTNYISAELSGPLESEKKTVDIDMGGFDDILNNMMNGIAGLGGVVGDGLFRPCEKCGENIPEIDVIDLAGRAYHPACAPKCPKCGKVVNPNEIGRDNQEEILQFQAKIRKENKAISGLQAMSGLYAEGSREAQDVARQVNTAEANIRRFQKKIEKLQDTGPGCVFTTTGVYHPDCFPCAEEGCTRTLESDEMRHPESGKPVCRWHFFSYQGMICATCDEPIDVMQNQTSVAVGDKRFHTACFKCHFCKKPMTQYRQGTDSHVYCIDCHTRIF